MSRLDIHKRLKEARKKLNLNQLVIASDLGIQQKSISEIENGKIQNIPNTYIYYFYKKGISLDWIYDNKDPMIILSSENQSAGQVNTLSFLFENSQDKTEKKAADLNQENTVTEQVKIENRGIAPMQDAFFERLIESKDFTIKSLMAYIQSLENTQLFLKKLIQPKE
ncbi:MAG: helix-turn-helix transcriptional regulator [Bacteroidales bacterium]